MGARRIGRILEVQAQKPLFFNYSSPRVNSGGLAGGVETAPVIGCIFLTLFSK
jgi:hypothetical protein